ncbi:uncharacterized protein C18orf25 homolog [Lampris incognitus]|uniref:uncharacterized protein C18orf25 homolog n=1 Tax=Lampris incognitus TaxID=2546036 RepID=UPI0024B51589|nr:uncharacterized protein C18orf25 homolog [Lampris incognitus]
MLVGALCSTSRKMTDSETNPEKEQAFEDDESLPDTSVDTALATTSSLPGRREVDSPSQIKGEPGLSDMPYLMEEHHRDYPESQHAMTGSDRLFSFHNSRHYTYYDIFSPSSSGHWGDSESFTSGEEGSLSRGGGVDEEGNIVAASDPQQVEGGQTSQAVTGRRRSRSESEMPVDTMASKRIRSQCTTSTVGGAEKQTKVKIQQSQKHKERMRLLRQKREAAVLKKHMHDSSTSESERARNSSISSTDDEVDEYEGLREAAVSTDISGVIIVSSDDMETEGLSQNTRCSLPGGAVINSPCPWEPTSAEQFDSTMLPQIWYEVWRPMSPEPTRVTPIEVVDLTLDDDD